MLRTSTASLSSVRKATNRKEALLAFVWAAHSRNTSLSHLPLLAPGTFITEWEDGAAVCEAFLKDEESYRAVADKLVQICCRYGFDGWLINVENSLSVSHVLTGRPRGRPVQTAAWFPSSGPRLGPAGPR